MITETTTSKATSINLSFAASSVLMVRPVNFEYNEQTALTNYFMDKLTRHQKVHPKALREFDNFVDLLVKNGVDVITVDARLNPPSPDSIFPNNWISTHDNGTVFLYPMEAENRRIERREDIINILKERFKVQNIVDLSNYEQQEYYLEGTGSMVLDRKNRIAYACLSSRTSEIVLNDFCQKSGYHSFTFEAFDNKGKPIYHTNVMMSIGLDYAVICKESIHDDSKAENIIKELVQSGKKIIEISREQINHFAGNILQLSSKTGEQLLVMSEEAYKSFTPSQISQLEKHGRCIFSPLYTIETVGGGSARCMIAEIFLEPKEQLQI